MVINSRPLSYFSADDLVEPLMPSHLMVGRRLMSVPDRYTLEDEDDNTFTVDSNTLTSRARYLHTTIDRFWVRWKKEYLLELRETHCERGHKSSVLRVSVNDAVIIQDDNQLCGLWMPCVVEELLVGLDGEARAAVLRVSLHRTNTKRMYRPVRRLYPHEMASEHA